MNHEMTEKNNDTHVRYDYLSGELAETILDEDGVRIGPCRWVKDGRVCFDERAAVCRECGMCTENMGDPDPCLGLLPDVAHACCGHGLLGHDGEEQGFCSPYVVVADGCTPNTPVPFLEEHTTLRHEDALEFFEAMGVGPSAR